MHLPRLTRDAAGTPGVLADDLAAAYHGIGQLHARLRPLQTLLLATAARGELQWAAWPTAETAHVDGVVAQLDVVRRARQAVAALPAAATALLVAYVDGVAAGLQARPLPWWQRAAFGRMRPPDAASVAGGLLLGAYLGQGEGQARMERALALLLQRGACPQFVRQLFGPAAADLNAALLGGLAPLQITGPWPSAGGSNAWAVAGGRSVSGAPLLAGDPHQPVGTLPGTFLELRVRLRQEAAGYLLGATVPGLPGVLVGRNRTLAWSGTFAFADNHDAAVADGAALEDLAGRRVVVRRRLRPATRGVAYTLGGHAVRHPLQAGNIPRGKAWVEHWAATGELAGTLAAYLQLPRQTDVAGARAALAATHTLNLQFVLADRGGFVCRQRAGATPVRRPGAVGLCAVAYAGATPPWAGVRLPPDDPVQGGAAQPAAVVATANDGHLPYASLPQPDYRRLRIAQGLAARARHDVGSMAALQRDVHSLQAVRLRPWFVANLAAGPTRRALLAWSGDYTAQALGAHAFAQCWHACLQALAPWLGGEAYRTLLATSELSVWWCKALDDLLARPATWQGELGTGLRAALAGVAQAPVRPWGEVQRVHWRHGLYGKAFGGARPASALPGSLATVCQGNLVPSAGGPQAMAPAYRMVADLAEDALHTALPGGIDERPAAADYALWLTDWQVGRLHRLTPPDDAEAPLR